MIHVCRGRANVGVSCPLLAHCEGFCAVVSEVISRAVARSVERGVGDVVRVRKGEE